MNMEQRRIWRPLGTESGGPPVIIASIKTLASKARDTPPRAIMRICQPGTGRVSEAFCAAERHKRVNVLQSLREARVVFASCTTGYSPDPFSSITHGPLHCAWGMAS